MVGYIVRVFETVEDLRDHIVSSGVIMKGIKTWGITVSGDFYYVRSTYVWLPSTMDYDQ